MIFLETHFDSCKNEVKSLERSSRGITLFVWTFLQSLVSSTVRDDRDPHFSRQKELKIDLGLSMISSFDSVVAVYVGLPCELFYLSLSLSS